MHTLTTLFRAPAVALGDLNLDGRVNLGQLVGEDDVYDDALNLFDSTCVLAVFF